MQLKAKGINFKYRNDRYILKDIDFEINSGEIVLVLHLVNICNLIFTKFM